MADLIDGIKQTVEKSSSPKWYVYVHLFPNGKFYVGMTGNNPKQRWQKGDGYKQQKRMYYAIKKYGWNNIQHFSVSLPSKQDAHNVEGWLIILFNSVENGYNSRYEIANEQVFEEIGDRNIDELYQVIRNRNDQVKWYREKYEMEHNEVELLKAIIHCKDVQIYDLKNKHKLLMKIKRFIRKR